MFKRLIVTLIAVAVVAVAGTAVAQTAQRFSDVPPDHEAFQAIEWAASAGVTAGYGDGTFKPDRPLSKRHAVVFMERFYDEILGAEQSEDFTRSDMMRVLYEMSKTTPPTVEPDDEPADGLISRPMGPRAQCTYHLPELCSPAFGTLWYGTSTLADEPVDLLCGRGKTDLTWDLPASDSSHVVVLLWNPERYPFYIEATDAGGATERMEFAQAVASISSLTFGNDWTTDIDAGHITLEVNPNSGRSLVVGDWGLANFITDTSRPSWATSKLLQQWANSVRCWS